MKNNTNKYFKDFFGSEYEEVQSNITDLIKVGNSDDFITWCELVLIKKPNVIDNLHLYVFIKNNLRKQSGIFKDNYDPNNVRLVLIAFQSAYESMVRKSFTVIFEAVKKRFNSRSWYATRFKSRENDYNTAKIIKFINDCLDEENKSSGAFLPISKVFRKIHQSRINKIRNAVAHNIFIVEGSFERDSKVCYSTSDSRCYFRKKETKTIKTAHLFKLLDMLDIFHEMLIDVFVEISAMEKNSGVVFCEKCNLKSLSVLSEIPNKKCYFCSEVGHFSTTQ